MTIRTQKITPCLWFDSEAEEAAKLYTSLFEGGRIGAISRYTEVGQELHNKPPGSVMTVEFEIAGLRCVGLNGGPQFRFTPAFSLFVSCANAAETETIFSTLAEGGTVLMPLQAYPFSPRFGWCTDRFGLSWQVNAAPRAQRIAPFLMFVQAQCGRAEEAVRFYASVFKGARIERIERYGADEAPDKEGTVKHALFALAGQDVMAMDSAHPHAFTFNEAASLMIRCADQAEVDYFWARLLEGGTPQPCGWLKDRFGVSWQVVPEALEALLSGADRAGAKRALAALFQMQKPDIARLKEAYARG